MVYYNTPVGTATISSTTTKINNNFSQANTSFGVDHYNFADETENNGFHNTVTTPLIVGDAHPTTDEGHVKLYAMQDSTNLGLLQYSRAWNATTSSPAAPTPIGCFQSEPSPITLTSTPLTVLDFTGLPLCIASFYCVSMANNNTSIEFLIKWSGTTLYSNAIRDAGNALTAQISGSMLQIVSGLGATEVYWSLRFHRMGA
jgi:hypothetical protein